ncbi:MAG: ribonuclease HI family protein [Candidatus Gracilibacteria bacterium]|nr:ribonuclease HI family protein [Candidatus Gracilibacteria bacterium]
MTDLFSGTKKKSTLPPKKAVLFADGGARGNPGPAGAGCILLDEDKKMIAQDSVWCGIQTNNFAEYTGLIRGLELALENKITELEVFLDSNLIVEQMSGNWKIKNANLRPLWERACALREQFEAIQFAHIPREKNTRADRLANQAMDRKS